MAGAASPATGHRQNTTMHNESKAPSAPKTSGPGHKDGDPAAAADNAWETPAPPYPIISANELLKASPRPWLIKHILRRQTVTGLFGDSATYKSFAALDLAVHVAAEMPTWAGHKIKVHGPVIYIAAEGGGGMARRVDAWLTYRGLTAADIAASGFVLKPVPIIDDPAVDLFLNEIAGLPVAPVLIVIDTLSAAIAGADENGSATMSQAAATARRIAEQTGAAVLLVHHVGKGPHAKAFARGHSAFHCAADTMILQVRLTAGSFTWTCKKQRDDPDFPVISFSLEEVFLGMDEDDEAVTSLAVVPIGNTSSPKSPEANVLSDSEANALAVLAGSKTNMTTKAWRAALIVKAGHDIVPKTFQNWRKKLDDEGYVEKINGKKGRYRVTQKGLDALKAATASAI